MSKNVYTSNNGYDFIIMGYFACIDDVSCINLEGTYSFIKNAQDRKYFLRHYEEIKKYIFNIYHIEGWNKMVINNWWEWDGVIKYFDNAFSCVNKNDAKCCIFLKKSK